MASSTPASARPRRSAAANTSYQIQFPDLGSSEEEIDDEEEEEEEDGEDGSDDGEQDGAGENGGEGGSAPPDDTSVAAGGDMDIDPTQGNDEAGPSVPRAMSIMQKAKALAKAKARPDSKRKGQRKSVTIAEPEDDEEEVDSSSGSEYAPEVIKDKDGKVIQAEGEEESEDSYNEDDVEEEQDDGDSAAGEDDLSIGASDEIIDASVSDAQGLKHGQDGSRNRNLNWLNQGSADRRRGKGKGRAGQDGGDDGDDDGHGGKKGSAGIRVVGRESLAVVLGTAGLGKKAVPRRKPVSGTNQQTSVYDLTFTSPFKPPRLILTAPWDHMVHSPATTQEEIQKPPKPIRRGDLPLPLGTGLTVGARLLEHERQYAIKRNAFLPFGPHWDVCEDYAFQQDKFEVYKDTGDMRLRRAERWGGWYPQVAPDLSQYENERDISAILPYLPKNLYPPLPSAVHLTCASGPKTEEQDRDDEAWEAGDVAASQAAQQQEGGTRSNAADMFTQNAGSDTMQTGNGDAYEDDGIIRLYVGPVGDLAVQASADHRSTAPRVQHQIEVPRFTSLRLDSILPHKPGFLLNAGGPVHGLDWAPMADDEQPAPREYLAISTVSENLTVIYRRQEAATAAGGSTGARKGLIQLWSLDTSCSGDFAAETLPDSKGAGMRLELAVLLEMEMIQLRWCPRGGAAEEVAPTQPGKPPKLQRLGLLAALSADGQLFIFDIPTPDSLRLATNAPEGDLVFIKANEPRLTLDLGTMTVSSFDWISHRSIAAACNSGHVATFDIENAMVRRWASVGPTNFFPVHEAPIMSITVVREPNIDREGVDVWNRPPTRICTSALDGSTKLVDLDDIGMVFNFGHERAVRSTVAYQPASGGALYLDQELGLRFLALKMRDLGATTRAISTNGPATDLAVSNFHSFAAIASIDGTCSLGNVVRRMKRSGHSANYINKVYRMDYNRQTGALRMLDNMMPDPRVLHEVRGGGVRKPRKKKGGATEEPEAQPRPPDTLPSVAWAPEIAITRAAWHPSLRRAHLLASGMACGLVRVDACAGSWSAEAPHTVRYNAVQLNRPGDGGDLSD